MARWTVFTVIPESAPDAIQCFLWQKLLNLFLMQCCLRVWRLQAFSIDFRMGPLQTEMSPDFKNIFMMLCAVDYGIFNVFQSHNFTLRNIILKLNYNVLTQYFSRVLNLCLSLLLRDSASSTCSFYINSCYWPASQLVATCFSSYFFLSPCNFSMLSQLLLKMLPNSRWASILHETVKCLSFNS